jgi:hypothetical protein
MKLNLIPARTGVLWLRLGFQTFFKQPLALASLFVLFFVGLSLLSLLPFIGSILALVLLPTLSLGFMAASQSVHAGIRPSPAMLVLGLRREGQPRAMLILGACYAVGFLLILGASTLVDDGLFASLYWGGEPFTKEIAEDPDFQLALWLTCALYMPLAFLFWHAPALVHWHGLPASKSLFFSAVACVRNFPALGVFTFLWLVAVLVVGFFASLVAALLGGAQAMAWLLMPVMLLLGTVFFCSIYFSFRDSFLNETNHGIRPS